MGIASPILFAFTSASAWDSAILGRMGHQDVRARSWQYQALRKRPNVSKRLLGRLHYRGLLRVARREASTRGYPVIEQR
jgi:hypothetical protein